jgi:hypothetical protein
MQYLTAYVHSKWIWWGYLFLRDPLPEEGNQSSFWNAVFSSYLEHSKMDKAQKPNDSQQYKVKKYFDILTSLE